MDKGTGKEIAFLFVRDEAAFNVVSVGHAGIEVHVLAPGVGMSLEAFVLSEYGELMRVKDVLKLGFVRENVS